MRYVLVSIIAAIIMTVAAPAHAHSGGTLRGEVSIEIVSESGTNFLSIPHKDFTKGGTHIIKKYLADGGELRRCHTQHDTRADRCGHRRRRQEHHFRQEIGSQEQRRHVHCERLRAWPI